MKKNALFFWFLCALSVFPLTAEEIPAAGSPQVEGEQVLIEGILIVPGGEPIDDLEREPGVNIFINGDDHPELVTQLDSFLNKPLTNAALNQIKKMTVDYFREEGIYVAVVIPIQRVENGVVVFQVLEGKVGHIEFKGQKWYRQQLIQDSLGIYVGDPVDENEFVNRVTWANRNPFRKTQIILVPSKVQGETDLVFITKDRFPVRFYAGTDNTGFKANDVYRLYAGFNWGLPFTNAVLSYQYTASPNFHDFQSHTANYTWFLPWENIFTVFGTYGSVFPVIPGITVEGINVQGSGRYQVPIRPLFGNFRHYAELGFDYKFLKSNAFFVGDIDQAFASNQIINITQFLLAYELQNNWTQDLLTFKMSMFLSPWKNWWFPHQTSQEYNNLRAGSHVRYAYWRGAISNVYTTKNKFAFQSQMRGQLATGTLPTAEQFGLGGANTVRGYYEQQFVADNAVVINLEFYTPPLALSKRVKNELSFLVFFDYGYGYNYSFIEESFIEQNLMGIGPGVRYDIIPYFSGKLDYGFQVFGIQGDDRFGRLHFSVNASY